MADLTVTTLVAAAGEELSGQAVRGAVDHSALASQVVPPAVAQAVTDSAAQLPQGMDTAIQGSAQAAAQVPVFTWGGYIQALGILFVLVALFCVTLWLARRFGRFRFLPRPGSLPRDALVMEAQLPLGPRKGLMVVRFLNKRLLLGVTEQRISLLSEEQAEHEPDSANFQTIMENARRSADHEPAGPPPA